MSFRTVPVVLGTVLFAAPFAVHAQQDPLDRISLSASTTLTSNYLFRGVSQTNNDPAIQGSFDLSYDTGTLVDLYAGVWASSIEFRPQSAPGINDPGSVEIDYYGGLTGTVPDTRLSWDIGFVYFSYPDQSEEDLAGGGENEFNYVEGQASLGYSFDSLSLGGLEVDPSIGVSYAGTPDFFGETGTGNYVSGSMNLGLPYGFGFKTLVGYQDVEDIGNYGHYSLALSKQIRNFAVSVSWNDGFDNDFTADRLLDDQFEATVSASF